MRTWKPQARENLAGYLFITPGLFGFVVFVFFPVLFSLFLSFNRWSFTAGFGAIRFVGVKNFVNLFDDYRFKAALLNTVIFAFTTVPATLVLGLISASLIREYVQGKIAVRTMMFIPYISSVVAVSVVWLVIFHPTFGPVNEILRALGVKDPPKWFADIHWALSAIVVQTIWLNLGYYIVVYMAGLTAISPALYESAQIDGASYVQRFLSITVPGVSPTTFFLLIIGIINSFKVFDQIMVTTRGGPGTATLVFAVYIYNLAFLDYRMGYASSIAWIMFVVIAIITFFQMRQQRKYTNYLA